MKKLSKQAMMQGTSPAQPHGTLKKKSKAASTSFTPYNKSLSTQSDINLPLHHRYSIGQSDTPLAMNQNAEYFAKTGAGGGPSTISSAQHRLTMGTMHKPSNSQIAPSNSGIGDPISGLLAASSSAAQHPTQTSSKHSSKISSLKNKAAFEKFHPSQQLATAAGGHISEYSPAQLSAKPGSSGHSTHLNTHAHGSGTSSAAVNSKLSSYPKMSSGAGPSKRTYIRGSSKKAAASTITQPDTGAAMIGAVHKNIHASQLDERVKKSNSQSLIKMQTAQMVGAQIKEFQTHQKDDRKVFKPTSGSLGKKALEAHAKGLEATQSKKLIFSYKKDSKQKVTPTTVGSHVPKPALVGHHRRVQSHGTATTNTFNLKTDQPTTKIHSPKVEKATTEDNLESIHTTSANAIITGVDVASSGKNVPHSQFMGHPALAKQYKQEHQLNKSKTSAGVSQTSLNASRDQVSILSLNSFSRSTPKFQQVLSLPQSAMNYQAAMSRTGNLPAKMLSPHSQTMVKQSLNSQIAPAKTISIRDKKTVVAGAANTGGSSAPNEGTTLSGVSSVKKSTKIMKHHKLRLKHTQSTVQPSSTSGRQPSPSREGSSTYHEPSSTGKAQTLPRFDSRNQEKQTKSTASIKESKEQVKSIGSRHQFSGSTKYENIRRNSSTPKEREMEAVGEEFPKTSTAALMMDPPSHMTYKVAGQGPQGTVPHHQKSHSNGQVSSPGIYNMYMGQVKQLKKQRITMNKGGYVANNTQPTHFINLNAEASVHNMINSHHASVESLKKNSSILQSGAKLKMSVTGKAPMKLHLTMPPSAHQEKSHIEPINPLQDSLSQDQDPQTEQSLTQHPTANQVPPSLSSLQSQGLQQRPSGGDRGHVGTNKTPQISAKGNSGNQNRIIQTQSMSKIGQQYAQQQNASASQSLSSKNLTVKHKQLAKAIKQHHNNMVRHNELAANPLVPLTTKALSSSNHHGRLGETENLLDKRHIRSTLSPKNIQQKLKNQSQMISPPHIAQNPSQQVMVQNLQQVSPVEYLSERKRRTGLSSGNQLGPPAEVQKAWMSPNQMTSSLSEENDSAIAHDLDYVKQQQPQPSSIPNMMHQEGGKNPQQISAAIIKKIQNNYQVQVTNGTYDSTSTTLSAQQLKSITQKIKADQNSVLPYLHALQEISEVYPQNQALNSLLSQIHQGISTTILTKEDQIQKTHEQQSSVNKLISVKEEELRQAQEQIQTLERNENETRRSVQQMTEQIDQRDYKIEKLEHKILEHQKRARLMFKKQMVAKQERPQLDLLFDGNCSELERQSDERRKVFQENEELQAAIDELNEDMAYGKQRENKLMFFLYILKQMGYPISEVFEREIKDVPTSRFSKNFDDEYKVMHAQLWKERKQAKKEAKLVSQNGFGIDRDEILIESLPKSDRLVPLDTDKDLIFNRRHLVDPLTKGPNFQDENELNFYPLQIGPILVPDKPDFVPYLDINKVLVIKHRRAKGLSVSNMINKTDSLDHQSQSSEESLDSRGRPKRCPKPRLHKKILDQYGITTGARNILALESRVFKEKYADFKKNQGTPLGDTEHEDEEYRFSLNSQRAESMQSQRI